MLSFCRKFTVFLSAAVSSQTQTQARSGGGGGGANINIFVITEINCAENEYMNMSLPSPNFRPCYGLETAVCSGVPEM